MEPGLGGAVAPFGDIAIIPEPFDAYLAEDLRRACRGRIAQDVNLPLGVDGHTSWVAEGRASPGTAVAAVACRGIAGDGANDAGKGINSADALIARIGKVEVAGNIEDHLADFGAGLGAARLASIAREATNHTTGHADGRG